jgi:eukaryotic-like serine/threonine-protein kinase
VTASTKMFLAGRYRLGPLLGRGGMAEVYEAMDERLARPVAVKLLLPEFAAQAGMRDRFEAEARSAARLSHPSVVAVFDSGEDDGTPFIVMERLPGETLADRMGDIPLDVAWLRGMAQDVLGALGAAHAVGVVHRDVKPANILIAADGRAKVADFGIAKALEEAPSDLTGANQVLGTPAYLAPERLDGLPATPRSDLYAFGVVLYEALAGVRAFPGTTPLSVAYAIHHADPPPLDEVRPGLGADLVATVKRAMDRYPASRYATAAEMAAALETDSAAAGTAAADSTVAMASPAPESATVVMPIAAGAGTASSNEATTGPEPLWARGLSGGLVASLGRRTLLLALFIAGLVLIGVVALAAGGSDAGRPSGSDVTPTTIAPLQAPTTLPEVTTTTSASTAAPTAGPPAGGGSPGKGKGKGKA